MEAAVFSSCSVLSLTTEKTRNTVTHNCSLSVRKCCNVGAKNEGTRRRRRTRVVASLNDVTTVLDPAPAEITWQIVVGTIAGVTPFVVAGVEFSKRIMAQRRCEVCGGSGLVLREKEKDYIRCPECGGFLPWQSWKRFFSG
ncbi:uncharacterized protein LOC130731508 [Lotus japonicus]|uniref:uncharacterized protein LOC130731508 n=1 Tax=Lotus japonicus TaxID=34305 RepID=UPI002588C7B8|nr:uncharacterized protein LOC130731508 [Lotus japonicus]